MNKKEFLEKLKKHAKKNSIKLTSDKRRLNLLLSSLIKRKKKYGEFYCPCRLLTKDKTKDKAIICPCIYHLNEIKSNGKCFCGLFMKK